MFMLCYTNFSSSYTLKGECKKVLYTSLFNRTNNPLTFTRLKYCLIRMTDNEHFCNFQVNTYSFQDHSIQVGDEAIFVNLRELFIAIFFWGGKKC